MGAWGVKIYQDDVACDVKEEYVEALRKGISNEEITEKLIEEYTSYEDEEEEAIFWIALSDTQWKYGRLKEEVKENALRVIENGIDLRKWEEDSKLLEKRKQVLLELKEKLKSPQPPEKKFSKLESYLSPFKKGDLLLYQIKEEKFKEHKWYHKFVLFRVIAIEEEYFDNISKDKFCNESPVISLYNFVGDENNIPNISELSFVNSSFRNDDRFAVICFNNRDFKKADFKVLSNDNSMLFYDIFEKYPNGLGIGTATLNIYNFETYLLCELERKEEVLIQL